MYTVSQGLYRGLKGFKAISPGIGGVVKAKWLKITLKTVGTIKPLIPVIKKKKTLEEAAVSFISGKIAGRITRFATKPLSQTVSRTHKRVLRYNRKGGISGHSWIDPELDSGPNGRIIKHMVIIYHDAERAGKHLDIHIGNLSLIIRVSGKPVESKVKFNREGELTQDSKVALLDHIRQEVFNNSRVPQNLDHSLANAKCSWLVGQKGLEGYGSGLTRQIVAEDDVEFYQNKTEAKSLHMYAPLISPTKGLYLYRIFEGDKSGTPVCIWGGLGSRQEEFKDRLHLKLIRPEEFDKFKEKTDHSTTTRKYDGASAYFSMTGKGTHFFSPRFSKVTGNRIEYTFKLPELAEAKMDDRKTKGIGEVLFWVRTPFGKVLSLVSDWRGIEGLHWRYYTASEIGGILNSARIRPISVFPEYRLYRIDTFLGENSYDLPFFENRHLQDLVARIAGKYWYVVELSKPIITKTWEGLVAAPKDKSINEGYKIKWWSEAQDWEVIDNQLSFSKKGNVQGVIWFKSLDSHKKFKLGPGQIGSFDENVALMKQGNDIIGMVAKVRSRRGHEGRAAKIQEWHLDKGLVPEVIATHH